MATLPGELVHFQNQAAQSPAKWGERIFDVRSLCPEILAMQYAVQFKFPKLRGEYFLADAWQGPAKLGVTPRAFEKFTQNEHLPLAADHGEQPFHFTFNSLEFHARQALKGALLFRIRTGAC